MGDLNKRKGIIMGSEQEGDDTVLQAHVPLASMFGYSTDLRSMTQARSRGLLAKLVDLGTNLRDQESSSVSCFATAVTTM